MNHALSNVTMITASAGTGKTYSLMGEIARAINAGTRPSQILATTFTKKAAAELIDRVQAELFGQERPDAARQMSVSMVGTVNSVCSRLLQEYAVDAGLSPALQVIAEDEQLRIFQLATDDVFAEFTPRIQPLARRLGVRRRIGHPGHRPRLAQDRPRHHGRRPRQQNQPRGSGALGLLVMAGTAAGPRTGGLSTTAHPGPTSSSRAS